MPRTMTRTRYRLALLICFGTIILAILDQNIVSAALVKIASDLDRRHGLDLMPWVVTAFSLSATAAVPLYGRLCDIYGPRRVFLGVVATFVAGSVLCGISQTMLQLIVFRALQGLGAGGLISVTMVTAAHLSMLKPEGMKKGGAGPSGLAGIVFGVGMTVGPPVGGVFADHGIWRWIFYVNIPLGVLILLGALAVFHFPQRDTQGSIDYLGAALAGAFASCLLLACDWGGDRYAWGSLTILGMLVCGVALLGLFLWRQHMTASPILPLTLFRIREVRSSYVIQCLQGMALMGVIIYLLMYLQVVRGVSATGTGSFLAFLAAGITVSGLAAAKLDLSLRAAMTMGTSTAALVLTALAFTHVDTSLWLVRLELTVLGLGFGFLLGRLITVVQQAAPRHQMGAAIAGVRFFQLLGGAVGAAMLGSVLRRLFTRKLPGMDLTQVHRLSGAAHTSALDAFTSSLSVVFAIAAGFMVLAVAFAIRLPKEEPAEPPAPAPDKTSVPVR
ncbi:MFS transporter [Nocardia nova]|uniref:MFS transporter n=1 Tax=Nocardia nova TaxID=37330 RepID=UPI0033CC3E0C